MKRLFRKQLAIAILPVILLTAISTLWTTQYAEEQLIEQLQERLRNEAKLHAAGVRSYFDRYISTLETVSSTPVIQSAQEELILPYLAHETKRLEVEGLYYNDLKGNVSWPGGPDFNIADRDYFPRLQRGEIVITSISASRATGRPIILIVVPVHNRQGERVAALGMSLEIAELLGKVEALVPQDEGFAAISDSEGRILTQFSPKTSELREDLSRWLADRNERGASTRLGQDLFMVHRAEVYGPDWELIVGKRTVQVTRTVTFMRWIILSVSGLALLTAFAIAAYSSRQLLRPLEELVEVTRRFGGGERGARVTTLPNDELGVLGRAFNSAAEQITHRANAQEEAEQNLRNSEARFRMLTENISDAIFLHTQDGQIVDVNHAACTSLGYTREELLRLNVTDVAADLSVDEFQERLRRIASDKTTLVAIASRHRRKDGLVFPVEVNVVPLETSEGLRFLASARDVTLRKAAEDKMTKFFRLSTDMMCVADQEGNFRELSPAFEQVLGWTREELLAHPYLDLVHPEDRERTLIEAQRVFDGEGDVNFENRYRCKDGSYKWLQWRPFREVDEGVIYAIARDVTDSHRLTRLMEETSHAASVGGWELDFLSGELFWSDETYRLHDTTPEEYQPNVDTAINFYAPQSQSLIREAVRKAREEGEPWSLELELITAKNRRIWAHAVGRVEVENGRPVRAFGAFQDITARKKSEEERQKLDAQISELQRIESIGILAGGIAHDFNNVLTSVLGFARLAITEVGEAQPLKSHLEQIEKSSLHAADLCKQLLAYAGKGRFIMETINLSELVRDTSGLVESIIDKRATLELDLAERLPWVEGDATQLRQVAMNLIINASDALAGHTGTISVKTCERYIDQSWLEGANLCKNVGPGPYVLLEVSDTGCGMDDETKAKMFDPFFTTKFAGRGLGLAAVLGIVRSHDGAIRVDSTLGKGTRFSVIFPISPDDEDERAQQDAEESVRRASVAHTPTNISAAVDDAIEKPIAAESTVAIGRAVLIVDDDEAVLTIARTALERGGYQVLTALNGAEALRNFTAHQADIVAVLADATMPDLGGVEVLRQIRAQAPNLPLLLMSGYTENAYHQANELRLAGFISKPFRISELADTIDAAVSPD